MSFIEPAVVWGVKESRTPRDEANNECLSSIAAKIASVKKDARSSRIIALQVVEGFILNTCRWKYFRARRGNQSCYQISAVDLPDRE
jgi:hypothetical protein